jgi:hypothetical protein
MNVNKTNSSQCNDPLLNQQRQPKKCHGNRKDQRFRKKCRARGMKQAKIDKQLARRKQIQNKKNSTKTNAKNKDDNTMRVPISTNIPNQLTTTMTSLNKRKRHISLQALNTNQMIGTSTSSISLAQPLLKKTKNENNKIILDSSIIVIDNNIMNMNYRLVIIL